MIDFILEHWKILTCGLLVLISFILLLVRKRPRNLIDMFGCVKEAILEKLPVLINLYECPGNGDEKLKYVISSMISYIEKSVIGRQLTEIEKDYFTNFISVHVESILSTPEKKKGV